MIQSKTSNGVCVAPPTGEACYTKWSETLMGRTGSKKISEYGAGLDV